jgi:hypothetical protein
MEPSNFSMMMPDRPTSPGSAALLAAAAFSLMSLLAAGTVIAQDSPAPAPVADESKPAAEETKTSEVVPLNPIEARGKRSLFDEQAARRRKLLDDSGPCLGCDAKPLVHHPKLLERLADAALNQVTPQAAPEPDQAGSVEHEVLTESRHPTNSTP